jgi:uncharacterized protein
MKKVLITGTGVIGKALAEHLDAAGYKVKFLSTTRSYYGKFPCYFWDVKSGKIDPVAFENVYAVIHLAGAGIADKRWSDERKALLRSSRIDTAQLIFDHIKKLEQAPSIFITASGSNYYGVISSEINFEETAPHGTDFVGELCRDWEQAARQFEELGLRTAALRTGVVISSRGGALPKLRKVVKWLLGAPLGNGKQLMPWIHIEDLCAMYRHILDNENCSGPYNAVSSERISNRYFMRALGKVYCRPIFFLPIPGFLLRLVMGEGAVILLKGSHLSNQKICDSGFTFKFSKLQEAVEDVELRKK